MSTYDPEYVELLSKDKEYNDFLEAIRVEFKAFQKDRLCKIYHHTQIHHGIEKRYRSYGFWSKTGEVPFGKRYEDEIFADILQVDGHIVFERAFLYHFWYDGDPDPLWEQDNVEVKWPVSMGYDKILPLAITELKKFWLSRKPATKYGQPKFIPAKIPYNAKPPRYAVKQIVFAACDFLDKTKSPPVWDKEIREYTIKKIKFSYDGAPYYWMTNGHGIPEHHIYKTRKGAKIALSAIRRAVKVK